MLDRSVQCHCRCRLLIFLIWMSPAQGIHVISRVTGGHLTDNRVLLRRYEFPSLIRTSPGMNGMRRANNKQILEPATFDSRSKVASNRQEYYKYAFHLIKPLPQLASKIHLCNFCSHVLRIPCSWMKILQSGVFQPFWFRDPDTPMGSGDSRPRIGKSHIRTILFTVDLMIISHQSQK